METWKIKVLRPFYCPGGVLNEKDSIISVGRLTAIEMISANKAVRFIEPKPPDPPAEETVPIPAPVTETEETVGAPEEKPFSNGKKHKK